VGLRVPALELARTVLSDARTLDHAPLLTAVMFTTSDLLKEAGEHKQSEALLREDLEAAAAAKDDVLIAQIWGRLIYTVGYLQGRPEEALGLRQSTTTAAARTGSELVQGTLASQVATLLYAPGNYDEGLAELARSIEIIERIKGFKEPRVAVRLGNQGLFFAAAGRYEDARMSIERSVAMQEATLGSEHPAVASSLNNLGDVLRSLGRYAEARAAHERAMAIWEALDGKDSFDLGSPLLNLGNILLYMGEYEQAVPLYQRSLEVWQKSIYPIAAMLAPLLSI